MFSLVFLLKRFLSLARHHAAPVLCWPQTFNELSRSRHPLVRPLFRSESGCKSTAFFITRNTFFQFFETFLYYIDYQIIKTTYFFRKAWHLRHKNLFFGPKRHISVKVFQKTFMFLKKKGDLLFYLPDLLLGNTLLI